MIWFLLSVGTVAAATFAWTTWKGVEANQTNSGTSAPIGGDGGASGD